MSFCTFIKKIFFSPKKAYLKKAEDLLPAIERKRQEDFEESLKKVSSFLSVLYKILEEQQPVSSNVVKLYLTGLLEETRNILNHFVWLKDPESFLVQQLEKLEASIDKLMHPNKVSHLLALSINFLDIEDRFWAGEELSLLAELRNILRLPVPETLIFTPYAWDMCITEGVIKNSYQKEKIFYPYELKATLKEVLRECDFKEEILLLKLVTKKSPSVETNFDEDALIKAYIMLLEEVVDSGIPPQSIIVQEKLPKLLAGELYTSAPDQHEKIMLIIDGRAYYLPKFPAFDFDREFDLEIKLTRAQLVSLLTISFIVEKYLRFPVKFDWILTTFEKLFLIAVEPLRDVPLKDPTLPILLEGGIPVFHGLVSGKVVFPGRNSFKEGILVLSSNEDWANLPLEEVKGVIFEAGIPGDFLATACQRLKIPALFQVKGINRLSKGMSITLDTYQKRVYQGTFSEKTIILPFQGQGIEAAQGYRLLRRVANIIFATENNDQCIEALIKTIKKGWYEEP